MGTWRGSDGLGDISLLGLSHGGNSAWKGGFRHSKVKPMSPVPKCSVPFLCQPLFPITRWELRSLSPRHPRSSKGFSSHHCPSAAPGFWGSVLGIRGSHRASEVLVGMREREVKWLSSGLKIPPLSPGSSGCPVLTAQHGDSRAARQCCASSKLIGIVTCLPLFVRAPASLRL